MKGHNPILALDEKGTIFICISMWRHNVPFFREVRKMSQICIFKGVCQLITILHRGEGSIGTPNFYCVINGQPLISFFPMKEILLS